MIPMQAMLLAAAITVPDPTPSPAASASPCGQGGVAAVADRPGLGRALTVNGSPCVVPKGEVVLEVGFRQEMTRAAAGVSTLVTFPQPLLRWGVSAGDEIVVAPSLLYSQRSGANLGGAPYAPADGLQDAGFGFKVQLHDRRWLQDAVEIFVSIPTGYPAGAYGFSAGIPTYLVGYSLVAPLNSIVSITTTQNLQWNAGTNAGGGQQGFFSYQPSFGFSFTVGARGAVFVQDQITVPAGPAGATSNRAFLGVQRTVSPDVVLDVEYELNLLPQPGFTQHAFGVGAAVRL
jgi:hypothetical protein